MSEEQEILIAGPPPIWVNEHQHLVGYGNGRWTVAGKYQKGPAIFASNEHYPCTEVMGRWITNSTKPDQKTIDMRPYKYAGHPNWAWMFRDVGTKVWNAVETDDWTDPRICSKDGSHSVVYGYGLITDEGELLGLCDEFTTSHSYDGYMMLMQTPYDCIKEWFYFLCYSSGNSSGRSWITYAQAQRGKTWC